MYINQSNIENYHEILPTNKQIGRTDRLDRIEHLLLFGEYQSTNSLEISWEQFCLFCISFINEQDDDIEKELYAFVEGKGLDALAFIHDSSMGEREIFSLDMINLNTDDEDRLYLDIDTAGRVRDVSIPNDFGAYMGFKYDDRSVYYFKSVSENFLYAVPIGEGKYRIGTNTKDCNYYRHFGDDLIISKENIRRINPAKLTRINLNIFDDGYGFAVAHPTIYLKDGKVVDFENIPAMWEYLRNNGVMLF